MKPLFAAMLLLAGLAKAAEVLRTDQSVLTAGGFYKNVLSGTVLQPKLVEGAALSGIELPKAGATDAQLLRVGAGLRVAERYALDAAWQLNFLAASNPAFAVGGATLTNAVGGIGEGPQRRLVPLEGTIYETSTTRLDHNLDRLALKAELPFGDLTIGRQVLSWGTGRFFNPTDVLSPFPPTAIDREVRRGFDAVRLAIPVAETSQLDLLYLPQQELEDNGGVARFQANVIGWDGSVSFGKYVHDLVAGFDLVGDVGPVSLHAEGAYTLELLGLGTGPVTRGEHFFRGVAGADFLLHEKVTLTSEYSFNGFGSTDPSEYAAILASPRARRGEVFGAGMHVVALATSFRANDLLSTQLSVLCNVTDPSALAFGAVEYAFSQAVLVRAGAYLPIGRAPDPALFATSSRGLRSEYGSGSYGAFLQVGLYIP